MMETATVLPHRAFMRWAGQKIIAAKDEVHGMSAFLLITLSVGLAKINKSTTVVRPLIRRQIERAGIELLPMTALLSLALGMVVIGQTVFLLHNYGAESYAGTVMASVIVRELGPAVAALLVLARVGTANVVELGTARAMGEVEALEALGVDPIHYLVVPRVMGLALAIFSLTVYFIMLALVSGYLFAFLQNVPLRPSEYFQQLAAALVWQDFVLVALKTLCFGTLIAIVTCYEGLASPLALEEVSRATTAAVSKCIVGVVLLDALFILVYLVV
jgi:phospholipid/cholesterol/gamma-HCH transport system permease protein